MISWQHRPSNLSAVLSGSPGCVRVTYHNAKLFLIILIVGKLTVRTPKSFQQTEYVAQVFAPTTSTSSLLGPLRLESFSGCRRLRLWRQLGCDAPVAGSVVNCEPLSPLPCNSRVPHASLAPPGTPEPPLPPSGLHRSWARLGLGPSWLDGRLFTNCCAAQLVLKVLPSCHV